MKPTAGGRKPTTASIQPLTAILLSLAIFSAKRVQGALRSPQRHRAGRSRRGTGATVAIVVLSVLLCAGAGNWATVRAAAAGSTEYQVKAAFLYNFLKFVDWPADTISSPSTICIGILGRNPFEDALETLKGKNAKGRRVVIAHFRSMDEVKGCDLLFISASEKGHLATILRHASSAHLLTVSDQDGFCEAGGMINLTVIKNRVGFDINVAAANRARLKISSQLLKLAHDVLE